MLNNARNVLSSNVSSDSSALGPARCLGGAGDADGDGTLGVAEDGVIFILLPCADSPCLASFWSVDSSGCCCCGGVGIFDGGRGVELDSVGEAADDDVDVVGPPSFANLLLRI
jgi:hypothetical protein